MEMEERNEIPFLDVSLIKHENSIVSRWYRKPTNKGRLIDYFSAHPHHIKRNCIRSYASKTLSFSNKKYHRDCINLIADTLRKNHYPTKLIKSTIAYARSSQYNTTPPTQTSEHQKNKTRFTCINFCPPVSSCIKQQVEKFLPDVSVIEKPILKLKQNIFSRNKSTVPLLRTRNVVYRINCLDCNKYYIGRTSKRLEQRIQQHQNDCRLRRCKGTGTALSSHVIETGHTFDFDNPEIMDIENNQTKLELKESYHIKNNLSNTVNFRVDSSRLHPLYDVI